MIYGNELTEDSLIVVASPQEIYSEVRLWFVDGRIVTASVYKEGQRVIYRNTVDPSFLWFASELADRWAPHRAFVMDVAETPKGHKVIEVNNINSAGLYAADVSKLAQALEAMEGSVYAPYIPELLHQWNASEVGKDQ